MGPEYVIIKKGEHGALVFYKGDPFYAPALPLEKVVDPTGAGDSFAGGLSGYLAAQQSSTAHTIKEEFCMARQQHHFVLAPWARRVWWNRVKKIF